MTDSRGAAEFSTVFPGWYAGRAVHIHTKVHVGAYISGGMSQGGHVSHTGQLFFAEDLTRQVAALTPYKTNRTVRTTASGRMGSMDDDLNLARRATRAGAAVALGYFAALADLPHELKADGSVVTEADRAVETAIREVLSVARPGDAILGEEGGATGDGRRRWIIDPIDGTALFVAGDDRWLVLIALEVDGEPAVAVAAHPAQERCWWATRGGGAYEGGLEGPGRPVTVAAHHADLLADSRVAVIPTDPDVVAPLLAIATGLPWTAHPGLLVARGDLDLAVQTAGQIWDFAATSLIVTEAGGVYRNLDGGTRPAPGASLYARDEPLADQALAVLRP
jgi:histidinol-phosphatase